MSHNGRGGALPLLCQRGEPLDVSQGRGGSLPLCELTVTQGRGSSSGCVRGGEGGSGSSSR